MPEKKLAEPTYHFTVAWMEERPVTRRQPDGKDATEVYRAMVGYTKRFTDEREAREEWQHYRFRPDQWLREGCTDPEVGPLEVVVQLSENSWETRVVADVDEPIISDELAKENIARIRAMIRERPPVKRPFAREGLHPKRSFEEQTASRPRCPLCTLPIIPKSSLSRDGRSHLYCEQEKAAGRDPKYTPEPVKL